MGDLREGRGDRIARSCGARRTDAARKDGQRTPLTLPLSPRRGEEGIIRSHRRGQRRGAALGDGAAGGARRGRSGRARRLEAASRVSGISIVDGAAAGRARAHLEAVAAGIEGLEALPRVANADPGGARRRAVDGKAGPVVLDREERGAPRPRAERGSRRAPTLPRMPCLIAFSTSGCSRKHGTSASRTAGSTSKATSRRSRNRMRSMPR